LIHTHTFGLADVPKAIQYARERIDGAIKVVVKRVVLIDQIPSENWKFNGNDQP